MHDKRTSAEAAELSLHADNTYPLYRQTNAAYAALACKVKRGTFDMTRAPGAFARLADATARDYCATYCEGAHAARTVFPPASRREFCDLYARNFLVCLQLGCLDDLGDHAAQILRNIPVSYFPGFAGPANDNNLQAGV
jgi:hypothetical protein